METETAPLEASSPQCHPNPDTPPKLSLFDDPDADIVIQSCDLREFRVLKLDVIRNSPVLGDLIQSATIDSSGSSTSTHAEGLPCVQLPENRGILSSLLSFILPVPPILPPTAEKIMKLLSVAQKYQMTRALAHIRGAVASQDPPFIRPETAFHIFSLAQKYGLGQEVVRAARIALTFPMTIEDLEDKLDTIHGAHLHILWKYHQSIRISMRSDLTEFRTSGAHGTLVGLTCQTGTSAVNGTIPGWVDDYIASIGEDPALCDLTEFHMCLTRHAQYRCTACGGMPIKMIRNFWKALTAVVRNNMINGEQDLLLLGEETDSQSHTNTTRSATPSLEYLDPPHADLMVQSSDLVNFRVNKVVLSMSSPFFADMFSLPQPSENEVVDGLPVVQLPEDAEILSGLLTVLYPVPSAVPGSYGKALQLLAASQKYDMAGVQDAIRTEIGSWGPIVLTGTEAFRAFAISSGAKLLPEMETFARHTLDFPMTLEYLSDELPLFEGWALRDLVRYRKRCRDSLATTFDSFLDSNVTPSKIWVVCTADSIKSYPRREVQVFPQWLSNLLSKHRGKLQETFTSPFPSPSNIRGEYLAALNAHISSQDCIPCMRIHTLKGEKFLEELEDKLTMALDKESVIT
ncbi:hypothetical protein EDB85DRAFT_2001975 [Lactarius pseudohatsudake]|nr:hypothetical protein EDB85DRAFT_2001975 [Lactarius pseudohatsudake]